MFISLPDGVCNPVRNVYFKRRILQTRQAAGAHPAENPKQNLKSFNEK